MDITAMKAEALSLAAAVEAGDLDKVEELRALSVEIKARQDAAEVAAQAVALADTAVETLNTETRSIPAVDARSIVDNHGRNNAVMLTAEQRALVSTGSLNIVPTGTTVSVPAPKTPVTDLLSKEIVVNGVAQYIVENYTDASDVVAEGDEKPEASYSETPVTIAVPTVAVVGKATRQALASAPTLASKLNRLMNVDLVKKIEADAVSAIVGAEDISSATGATLLAAVRNAIAKVEEFGYSARVALVNPADAAAADIEAMNVTVNGAARNGAYWGIEVVTSNLVPTGTAFVVDTDNAARIFTSGGVALYSTDSHGDDFTHNIIRLLAETDVVTAVVAPKGICSASID